MSVTAAAGFVAAGVAAGIKPSGDPDLSLVATDDGSAVPAAGVFTTNKMTAAPVLVTRASLDATGGRAGAVVLNSGNANAATGQAGRDDAEKMCALVGADLGLDRKAVLVCSTGLIGVPLPMEAIAAGIPAVVAQRSVDGGAAAAEAIRTTDSHRKEAVHRGSGFTVGGMGKGAAMLEPDMATMLAVLTTDAAVGSDDLRAALSAAVADTFNTITTDGSQSTNDTVLVLASGRARVPDPDAFRGALRAVCGSLAEQMVHDAEGATKVVRVRVRGAATEGEAQRAARAVANSQLIKCSWYGKDPYWGRVASEIGRTGIHFESGRVAVSYGPHLVAERGVSTPHDAEALTAYMDEHEITVTADLGVGRAEASVLTCDLSHAYVDENMGTS